ncbi:MAG TPA: alpha/beta fold hydrolase [Longimicrobiales bacterium]|nr:alpha/beta fold hydrolase [Longimicrobiales bacterium]
MTLPLVSTPHGDGPRPLAGELVGADDVRIRTWRWPVESPVGRIQLLHGFSEHLGRYIELAGVLNRAGWSVFGHDHRGHGQSGGRRGILRDFDHFLSDVDAVRSRADQLAPGPGAPLMLGHSMGGLIAIRYLQTAAEPPPRAVISAPWLGTGMRLPLWQRVAVRTLRYVLPEFVMQRSLDVTPLTRDPSRGAAYRDDPLVHRAGSAGLLHEIEAAQEAACATGVPDTMSVLLLLPLDDDVVDSARTEAWAASIPDERLRIERFPNGRHEPFHDIERETVFRLLADWLNEEAPRRSPPEHAEQV